jgi:hypothetical protein
MQLVVPDLMRRFDMQNAISISAREIQWWHIEDLFGVLPQSAAALYIGKCNR